MRLSVGHHKANAVKEHRARQARLEEKDARKNHRAAYVDAPYCFL
jgi:hypothetical protein